MLLAAPGQRANAFTSQDSSSTVIHNCELNLKRIIDAWPILPSHIRQTICALIDAVAQR